MAPRDSIFFIAILTDASTSLSIPSTKYSFGPPIFIPFISLPSTEVKSGTAIGADVESYISCPEIMFRSIAESLTFFVIGPIWSRDDAKATSPYRETLPYVGLNPTTPQSAAGCLIEPPVSEPRAAMHISAETAAADPPLEPPGILVISQGFR